jgi:hypothetical protein
MKSKNDYYFEDNVGHIILRNRKKEIVGVALFDIEDKDKVQQYTWSKMLQGYVFSNPYKNDTKRTLLYLHRYIFGCVSNDGIILDHINRNKLDNRWRI